MIFVVDDHHDTCEAVARMLKVHGYQAKCLVSGADALPVMHGDHPTLLILDMMMPGMNGLDVLRAVRRDPSMSDLPVLMLSATSNEGDIEEARRLGISTLVGKGRLDWRQLMSTVGEIVPPPG